MSKAFIKTGAQVFVRVQTQPERPAVVRSPGSGKGRRRVLPLLVFDNGETSRVHPDWVFKNSKPAR